MVAMRKPIPSEREDHTALVHQPCVVNPLALLILEIRETQRMREDMQRAELRLLLQIKAIERRYAAAGDLGTRDVQIHLVPGAALVAERDHRPRDNQTVPVSLATLPLETARQVIHKQTNEYTRRLEKLAKQLPVWPWVESVRGFGALGLAQIVGECGNLSDYDGPAKVWKRMGVAVIEGERQRRVSGADALTHGYVARRRSILYNIGESLLKGNRDGAYRTLYLERKPIEREKLGPEAPQAHVHNRARRYMEKRLLRDLWRAWRRA